MRNTTYRRWAIFYATATALLAVWLLFEKMPDGREELAVSVERTFWGSGEAMERDNKELMVAIQDEAADYPSPGSMEYKNRAAKALTLAEAFDNRNEAEDAAQLLCLLRDSLTVLADSNEVYLSSVAVDTGLTNRGFKNFNALESSQLSVQMQAMTASVLNYCHSKVETNDLICRFGFISDFVPHNLNPMIGEPFQATFFLSDYDGKCAIITCFLKDHPIPLRDGVASIRTTFPTPGQHTLRLRFRRERCRDGSVTEVSRDFKVNVLERCDTND